MDTAMKTGRDGMRITPRTAITAEHFEKRTGNPPQQDDLERSNCVHAGETGHFCCGWNEKADMPVFAVGPDGAEG